MSKVTQDEEKKATELGLGLEELIRRGARELIQKAIETELGELLSRYGNVSTLRRVGKLLELEGVAESLLRKLSRRLTTSSALTPWVPSLPKRGTVDRR